MQAILDYINDNFMHFRNAVKLQLFCSGGLGMIIVIFQLLPLKKIILFEKKSLECKIQMRYLNF